MLILQGITYIHPDKDLLFENIDLTLNDHHKIALIGNNGIGKSTMLKIIAGIFQPSRGVVTTGAQPYFVPQHFGQFDDWTVAEALQVDVKLNALWQILNGDATEANFTALSDDWSIEERCEKALAYWQLQGLDLTLRMNALSGGQKTRVFLAGMMIHQPGLVLMDEPSNHLDTAGRSLLYDFIRSTTAALLVVSHDRKLLNFLDTVCELSKQGITVYGGNYDFYAAQKQLETDALDHDIRSQEKALRKARELERETKERKAKLDARGKNKQEKAGVPAIMMKTLRNNAEKSSSRLKDVHAEKISGIATRLSELRTGVPDVDRMKFGFNNASLHAGKLLITAENINYEYEAGRSVFSDPLDFSIFSGERVAIVGSNGSGKSTLVKLVLGDLEPVSGVLKSAVSQAVYVDQDYSLIDGNRSVYEQAQEFNSTGLQEHDVKIRLNRFLFDRDAWHKPCSALSGGEKMRLMLCCLTIASHAPDMIILDEPTNNLDLQNIGILTAAIRDYQGTLLVISHDERFLQEVNISREIVLGEKILS